jgi:hypothetical protein
MKATNYCLIIACLIAFCFPHYVMSQGKDSVPDKKDLYIELMEKAEIDKGLFTVFKLDDKYYFGIPDSLFSKDMLMVTRTSKTAMDMGYGGESLDERVFVWENRANRQVLLRTKIFQKVADKDSYMYEAVYNSSFPPIIAAFDIKDFSTDSTIVIVEVTDVFKSDVLGFGLNYDMKQRFSLGNIDDKRSYIASMGSFPGNIEVKSVKTYSLSGEAKNVNNNRLRSVTLEIRNSMHLLPEEPMKPRFADHRVGFFAQSQYDYGIDEAQKATRTRYIKRWKLEPTDEEAYFRGELVEPQKPITYYLDPSIPSQWIPYFIQGVEDWNVAFEQAGFKNAIKAKAFPSHEENPDFDPMDARYTVIAYFASETENAYGPHVADPRSGEIVNTVVCIYHNVMKLVHNWYMIQCGAVDPRARQMVFEEELMGRLMRFLVAHEVGHTLGLAHNFAGSAAYPVDSLRSKTFTDQFGTSSSIMDYARFNYVAQPDDGVENLFPVIGPYDKHAIEWGYRYYPKEKTSQEEHLILNELVKSRVDNPLYRFGRQFFLQPDPRAQAEDLGDNPMRSAAYGLKNLQIVMNGIGEWTGEEGEGYEELNNIYGKALDQWRRYMWHVIATIDGTYTTPRTTDQEGVQYEPVPREIQKEAIDFLAEHAFQMPDWLIRDDYYPNIDPFNLMLRRLQERQISVFNRAFSLGNLMSKTAREVLHPDNHYPANEYLYDMRMAVWRELYNNEYPDVHKRSLERAYIARIDAMLQRTNTENVLSGNIDMVKYSDVRLLLLSELESLQKDIRRKARRTKEDIHRVHYRDLLSKINKILEVYS